MKIPLLSEKFIILWMFSKVGFWRTYWIRVGRRRSSARHSAMEAFWAFFYLATFAVKLPIVNTVGRAKRTSTYRTMTPAGHICPFPSWLRTWFLWWLPPCWRTSNSISSVISAKRLSRWKKTSRLKVFILYLVSVPAKWMRTERRNVLNLYTNNTYYSEIFLE